MVVLVELAVAMAMEHDGAIWLMIPCDHRIMAESQHKILRQERAGGRLDSQIEDLCRSLEIVGVCPYGTVVIALYEKLLSWKLFQQMTGIFALEECEVAENIIYLLSEMTVFKVPRQIMLSEHNVPRA